MNRTFGKLFALVAIAAVFAVACGNSPAAAKKMIIGDILYNNDAYQTAQQKQMQAYADSLGIQIVFENQLGVGTNAPNLMDDLLAKGVQGIIFQPADAAVSVPLVKEAQAKKIPVLGWAIPFGTGITAPYVGLDERAQTVGAGTRAAQWVKTNYPGKQVDVLLVTIQGASICADIRMGGFKEGVLSVAPDAKITTVDGAGSREKAVTVAEDALQRDKGFNVATGCNSDMAFGALQAFKSAGLGGATNKKPDHTYFYSINGTDEELKALVDKSSPLMEVLGLTPKEISQTLIDTLLKMIKGTIDPYGSFVLNVPDKPIPADCAAANAFNKGEYLATADLPC
ncbi:MAG TPA: sugar ABC transporter substrate-binding protein [Candidatus Dormibacteraeota bacterium]|nr:sugar ABC transporter substrate-binding protein [Candidatus Dormibacteraeota bacterium]